MVTVAYNDCNNKQKQRALKQFKPLQWHRMANVSIVQWSKHVSDEI